MAKNIQAAVDVLQDAKSDALTHLEGLPNLQNTVRAQIDALIGGLSRVGRIEVSRPAAAAPRERKPLRHIAGVPIGNVEQPKTAAELAPTQEAVSDLEQQISEAMQDFLELPAEELIKLYSRIVIRGVAYKAGMIEVTDIPDKITINFIEAVKAAVALKAELDHTVGEAAAAGTTGKEQAPAAAEEASNDNAEDAVIAAMLAAKQAVDATGYGVNIHVGRAPAPVETEQKAIIIDEPAPKQLSDEEAKAMDVALAAATTAKEEKTAPAKTEPAKAPANNKPGKNTPKA